MRILVNEFCGHPFGMDLSRELARKGHAVCHVYFADNKTTPKGSENSADSLPGLSIEGLHIQRPFAKHGLFSRRAADIEYGRAVATRAKEFRPDVVISGDMPLDAQRILLEASHRLNARFIFWLQDVYCLAVRFVLRRKAPFLASLVARYYERLEKKLLRESDGIICIAPAFAEQLARWGIPDRGVTVIPNWAPVNEIVPTPKDNGWARAHGVADTFCFMYSGTLGMKHRPELLLALAKDIEKRGDARLIVVAAGAGADWLEKRKHEVSPNVLTLLPFQPYERVPEVIGSADVLITLLDSEAGTFAVPSKALAYLCAGRAQIVAAPAANEAARVVELAQAGLLVSSETSSGVLGAAQRFLADPALRSRCATNARHYAERHFSIENIAARFLAVLEGSSEPSEVESGDLALASSSSERKESWKRRA